MRNPSHSGGAGARAEATLLDLEAGRFRYSAYRNLSIGVWTGQATSEAVKRVARVSQQMRQAHPGGHSSVVFVLHGAPAPTSEASTAFANVLDARATALCCAAIMVEGQGFWASGIRSAITNMRIAAPGTVMLRVHDQLDELFEWLPAEHFKRTGVRFDLEELRSVLEQARQCAANPVEMPARISWFSPD